MNYKTISELQTIDFRIKKNGIVKKRNAIKVSSINAIYGSNGSGKSNLLSALDQMKKTVIEQGNSNNSGRYACRSDSRFKEMPSVFMVRMWIDKRRYEYILETTNGRRLDYEITKEILTEITNEKKPLELLNDCYEGGKSVTVNREELLRLYNDTESFLKKNKKKTENGSSDNSDSLSKQRTRYNLLKQYEEACLEKQHLEDDLVNIETSIKKFKDEINQFKLMCVDKEHIDASYEKYIMLITTKTANYEEDRNLTDDQLNKVKLKISNIESELKAEPVVEQKSFDRRKRFTKLRSIVLKPEKSGIKNNDKLKMMEDVYTWFACTLNIISPEQSTLKPLDKKRLDELSSIMAGFDVGINKLSLETIDKGSDEYRDAAEMIRIRRHSLMRMVFDNQFNQAQITFIANTIGKIYQVEQWQGDIRIKKMVAIAKDGLKYDLSEESDGTKRLIELAGIIMKDDVDKVYVIDELDRCLHTNLTNQIVMKYLDSSKQIIFTTHETHLLKNGLLDENEIWVVDNNDGVSTIHPMTDSNEYKITAPIEDQYIDGKLGGVAVFKN